MQKNILERTQGASPVQSSVSRMPERLRIGRILFYTGKRDCKSNLPGAVGYLWPIGINKPCHFIRKWWRVYFAGPER